MSSGRLAGILSAAVLAVAAAVSMVASWDQTATADEPIYVAAGLRILESGDERTNEISSPWLLKALLAAPAYCAGERLREGDDRMRSSRLALHWRSSWEWLHGEGGDPLVRLRWARLVSLSFLLATGAVCFAIGRRLGGPWLGCAGVVVFASWPEALGHGGLASLDMGVTLLTAATLWGAMPLAMGEAASRWRWIATGAGLGLCFLAKTSAVILTGFLVVLGAWWLVCGWRRRREGVSRAEAYAPAGRVLAVLLVAFLTLHAGFGFEGSFRPLGEHARWPGLEQRLEDAGLGGVSGAVGRLPSPLPASYLELLAVQSGIAEAGKQVFFHGTLREGGWWWFLPVGFVLKTPLLHLLLVLIGGACWLRGAAGRRREWGVPLGFVAFLFVFFVVVDRFGLVRYLLPTLPVLAVLAGLPLVALGRAACAGRGAARWGMVAVVLGLAGGVAGSHPWYLSSLQRAAGGPWSCHEWMADSNCDWGQDLERAAAYARAQGHDRVAVGYFGSGRPRERFDAPVVLPSIGVAPEPGGAWWYDAAPPAPLERLPDRPVYLSVTLWRGAQLPGVYALLADREPDAMATPSIAVFLPPHER